MSVFDRLLALLGWRALAINSDPLVTDRMLFVSPWLLGPAPDVRTLDAGCGNGAFAFQAAQMSRGPVLAVSDDQEAIAKASRRSDGFGFTNIEFRLFDLRWHERYAELGEFDQILLLETIEHVANDGELLRHVASRLRVGGRLILTTPTHDHAPLFGEGRHLSGGLEDGRHVRWGYSRERLTELVESVGLEVAYVQPVSGVLMRATTSLMWRMSSSVGRTAAIVLTAPLRLLRPLDPTVTRLVGMPSHCWGLVAVRAPE